MMKERQVIIKYNLNKLDWTNNNSFLNYKANNSNCPSSIKEYESYTDDVDEKYLKDKPWISEYFSFIYEKNNNKKTDIK